MAGKQLLDVLSFKWLEVAAPNKMWITSTSRRVSSTATVNSKSLEQNVARLFSFLSRRQGVPSIRAMTSAAGSVPPAPRTPDIATRKACNSQPSSAAGAGGPEARTPGSRAEDVGERRMLAWAGRHDCGLLGRIDRWQARRRVIGVELFETLHPMSKCLFEFGRARRRDEQRRALLGGGRQVVERADRGAVNARGGIFVSGGANEGDGVIVWIELKQIISQRPSERASGARPITA